MKRNLSLPVVLLGALILVLGLTLSLIPMQSYSEYTLQTEGVDSMVYDNHTKLLWEIKTETNKDTTFAWSDAISYCENLSYGGYTDWRLPNVIELRSIMRLDAADTEILLDTTYFTDAVSGMHWTSTTFASGTSEAWYVHFYWGLAGLDSTYAKDSALLARCVR